MENICKKLQEIKCNIKACAQRCGRDYNEITLVAVSKRQSIDKIKEAILCQHKIFGENYLQEAKEKREQLKDYKDISFHCIGHIQSNKAKIAVATFDVIETVDRIKLARLIDRHCNELDKKIKILIQVNIGREPQKHGVLPEESEQLIREITEETNLEISGLMTIPPLTKSSPEKRHYFREMKQLANNLSEKNLFKNKTKVELSMGMSSDYQIAIEEGATIVRVGTAIFGARD